MSPLPGESLRKATNEKMNCRLGMNELLDDSHMPVLMVMNMVKEKRFLEVLKALSKGNGFGEEYGACTLPEDLDDFDKANGEDFEEPAGSRPRLGLIADFIYGKVRKII